MTYSANGMLATLKDAENNLTTYEYDGFDRLSKTRYPNPAKGSGTSSTTDYELLVWYEGSGTADRRFASTDERGSVISLTGSSGNLIAIDSYDEYGQPGASNLGRFGYTGQKWLSELAAYDYKARLYSSERGRFFQTDPVGMAGGPNLYAYVLNDPVNWIDPEGLCIGGGGSASGTWSAGYTISCPNQNSPIESNPRLQGLTSPGERGGVGGAGEPPTVITAPQNEKKLPKCLQNFLKNRLKSNPADITLHRGSPFDLTGYSVTVGNDIYLTGDLFGRTDENALINKFHEIEHTSQYARGYSFINQAFAYVAFAQFGNVHNASPFEQAADDFATTTYDAYHAEGLDKTCKF